MRDAGIPLGAGVITVFDETRDLRKVILRLAHFFAEESCGKCYPCQLGTQRQVEILERMMIGRTEPEDIAALGRDWPNYDRCIHLRAGSDSLHGCAECSAPLARNAESSPVRRKAVS